MYVNSFSWLFYPVYFAFHLIFSCLVLNHPCMLIMCICLLFSPGMDLEVRSKARSRPDPNVRSEARPKAPPPTVAGADPYVLLKYHQVAVHSGLLGQQVWSGLEGQRVTTSTVMPSDLPAVAPTSIRKVLQMMPREGTDSSGSILCITHTTFSVVTSLYTTMCSMTV